MLQESARIARGDCKEIKNLYVRQFDVLMD